MFNMLPKKILELHANIHARFSINFKLLANKRRSGNATFCVNNCSKKEINTLQPIKNQALG